MQQVNVNSNVLRLKFPHVGSFLLLMFIATFRPTSAFEWWSISLEPVAFLGLFILLVYKINITCGFREFFGRYKFEIFLVAAYQLLSLFTLWSNIGRYESQYHAVRFGLHFIVLSTAMPMALWLFSLPNGTKKLSLGSITWATKLLLVYFLLIALLTIWQVYDYESAKVLSQFFVGSEIWPEQNINAIFKVNTDLGTILSMLLIFFLIIIKSQAPTLDRRMLCFLIALSMIIFIAGISTGSRNFFLTFFIGFFVLGLVSVKGEQNYIFGFTILFLFIVSMHLLVLYSPYALLKLSSVLPYFSVLNVGEVLSLNDFIPNINDQAFAGRLDIWTKAIAVIKDNPYLGVSNGAARAMINPITGSNSHNFVLQILLETGLVGFIILSLLVTTVIVKLKASGSLLILAPLLVMLLTALSFDYYLDHSLPWIITCSYLLAVLGKQRIIVTNSPLSAQNDNRALMKKRVSTLAVMLCLLFTSKLIWTYSAKNNINQQLPIGERMTNITSSLTNSYNDLIFVDDRFDFTMEQLKNNSGWRFNAFNIDKTGLNGLCHYAVPGSAFVMGIDKQKLDDSGQSYSKYYPHDSRLIAGEPGIVTIHSKDISCGGFEYENISRMDSRDWFSNRFDNKAITNKGEWPLWANITLTSKVFKAEKGNYQFSFVAQGHFDGNDLPQLEVNVYSLNGKQKFNSKVFYIADSQTYQFNFEVVETQALFLKLTFINDLLDDKNKAIFMRPETINVAQIDI